MSDAQYSMSNFQVLMRLPLYFAIQLFSFDRKHGAGRLYYISYRSPIKY